jgi:hypothetical protein
LGSDESHPFHGVYHFILRNALFRLEILNSPTSFLHVCLAGYAFFVIFCPFFDSFCPFLMDNIKALFSNLGDFSRLIKEER